ncbi:hypothetical protein RclHR1_05830003 [Rhizophagus clarus]|uniref:Uncharacterized protein n=1 Tax=Rhizophagus clarus TaxID=94130 RepID=A0A2Z6S1P4_9GLOM|nr:hypothetical protein RclHR1_05830003 [Rhizophagus clarus]GES92824.1 hypothetical protein GLOIN_2v1873041 [Rhizophagus clarus]
MTTTLTVVGLITRLKVTTQIAYGDATYRSDRNYDFSFKQFTNSQHEYNVTFGEGDLVLLGGKFTIDEQKLLLVVEMATIMEPKLGDNGILLKWNPTNIPLSKPFINITTSACEPVSTVNDMNFIKTKSLVYSPFHKDSRYINFEVGYMKNAKWLDHVNDKWSEYINFFVIGFLEAIYSSGGITYAQVDAKLIDYDTRFRHPNAPGQPIISPTRTPNNAFAQRRNQPTSDNSPASSKSTLISRTNSIVMEEAQDDTGVNVDPIIIHDDNPKDQSADNNDEFSKFMNYYKMFKSQESQNQQAASSTSKPLFYLDTSAITQPPSSSQNFTPAPKTRKRQLSDLCDVDDDEPDQPTDEPVNEPEKPLYNKTGRRGRGRGKK